MDLKMAQEVTHDVNIMEGNDWLDSTFVQYDECIFKCNVIV